MHSSTTAPAFRRGLRGRVVGLSAALGDGSEGREGGEERRVWALQAGPSLVTAREAIRANLRGGEGSELHSLYKIFDAILQCR